MSETAQQLEQMNWPDVLETAREKFTEIQPRGMNFTSERAFAIQHLKNNEYLMKVAMNNKASLQAAMLQVAAVGLSLNPAKKQAYLVPRKGKVCFDPSYLGLCDLATMSGSVQWAQARAVYSGDAEFIDNGVGEKPTHRYDARKLDSERGELQLVYCTAKTATGDYLTTIMPIDKINDIMNRSEAVKSGSFSPWKSDFLEMAKKTVVRNAFKMWPKTETLDRMALAVQISNENEGFQSILTSPRLGEYSEEQKQFFDQLIQNSDAIGMYTLQRTLDESTFNNLYHSFERGQKGKYQGIINTLLQNGSNSIADCIVAIADGISEGDDYAVLEIVSGLSADTVQIIRDRLDSEYVSEFIRITSNKEEAA